MPRLPSGGSQPARSRLQAARPGTQAAPDCFILKTYAATPSENPAAVTGSVFVSENGSVFVSGDSQRACRVSSGVEVRLGFGTGLRRVSFDGVGLFSRPAGREKGGADDLLWGGGFVDGGGG